MKLQYGLTEILQRSEMLPLPMVLPIAKECTELCRIIAASIRTVKMKRF